jgi:choline dehydrogenase
MTEFAERARLNQAQLSSQVRSQYDFIVCGSGSSGSVVARRLAENPEVSILLLEAGGTDDVPTVMEANQWPLNLGSERDWGFVSQPMSHLNGRSIPLSMGKVLGGGSSINVMCWARGHKNDWDYYASEAADDSWNYQSVLALYSRIEDWHGTPDPAYRGTGGPVFVEPAPRPNPIAPAMLEGAASIGIPTFDSPNGRMMEGIGGAAIMDLIVRAGKRQSIFRSYVYPYLDRANLTVLTGALVTNISFKGKQATGVHVVYRGKSQHINATCEVVLALGAIHTPKVLLQSGVGDQSELRRYGIPIVQHLPGVGQNFQDHVAFGSIWESSEPLAFRNNGGEATCFWRSDPSLGSPDLQICHGEVPIPSAETAARFNPPAASWTMFGGLVQPKSRGQIRISGANPLDPVRIQTNTLSHPDDMKAAVACVELSREIGNSSALRPFSKREVMPGNLKGADLEHFIRDAAVTYWHQTCTAKMGTDPMAVVDGDLRVYGIENLRIADGSILPRVTTGNTMAACVVVGERAGDLLKASHKLSLEMTTTI